MATREFPSSHKAMEKFWTSGMFRIRPVPLAHTQVAALPILWPYLGTL